MEDKYRITLYDTYEKSEVMTYDSPILPNAGNLLKLKGDLFIIKEICYPIYQINNLIEVELLGMFETDETMQKHDLKNDDN
jgi:hypothetical protein